MSLFSQIFPPSPTFTEKSLADLSGKVFLITGAASGVGLELAKMLYSKNGTVYIAARSAERANAGIKAIEADHPKSNGRLVSMVLDLADLSTVKPAVERFLEMEERLHVLVHNAAVMVPPVGSKTKLGYDLEMATNCLGPFLLNTLLVDILRRTAASQTSRSNTVRIVWVSSIVGTGPPKGGVQFDENGNPKQFSGMENYMQTKAGDVYLASEFAKRLGDDRILSVSLNPGLMMTELQRHLPAIQRRLMGIVFKSAQFGAYTELFAGLSYDVGPKDNGGYFIPWGRRGILPAHIAEGTRSEIEGGTGVAKCFFEWCERETMPYI